MTLLPGFTRLEFPCELASLGRIDAHFKRTFADRGIDPDIASDIQLCLNEAANNAVDHGSQFRGDRTVVVEYRIDPDRVVVLLSDSGGKAFDPNFFRELAIRKDWSVGGRGILIMYELMDEVSFFFVPDRRTTVMLVKNLTSPASAIAKDGNPDGPR